MTSHIPLIEDGRRIGLDGRPWSPTPVNAWAGMPCELHRHMQKGEVADRVNPNPLVFLRYDACGRSRIVSGSRTFDVDVAPGQVDVFPAGFEMDRGWWDCSPGALVSIEIRPQLVGALVPLDHRPPPLRPSLSGCDATLARIIDCIRTEIADGCPSGKLFADGLSVALLSRLWRLHGDAAADAAGPALDAGARRRLVDYVDANLGGDLRIASLAALVGLPSSPFCRAFRRTFGTSPHRYVTERRLEHARTLLASDQSLAAIAYTLGFSSQAHFTQAFQRRYGVTPGRCRVRGSTAG